MFRVLQRAFYYNEAFLCVIDRQHQQTYFLTVMFMVTLPTGAAVIITSRYLFTHAFKDQKRFYEVCVRTRGRWVGGVGGDYRAGD